MKNSFNLFPLVLCLLYSMAKASLPSKNDFDFLEPFNGTTLVADELELRESIAGLSLSTLLNLGIWWGVCKTAGIVSGLSNTHDLPASDTKELEKLQTDFCLQLAPVMTTAEVALAGHVSSWPLEQRWWKPLYFAGAGMAAYVANAKSRELIPVAVLTYLASEALSRTGASAISALILRKISVRDIATEWYATGEYAILSMINGIMAGAVVYEAMIHRGLSPAKATFASVVSAATAGTLSGIISVLTIDLGGQTQAGVGVVLGVVLGVAAGAGAGVAVGVVASVAAKAGAGALVRNAGALVGNAGASVGLMSGALVGAGAGVGARAGIDVGVGVATGVIAGATALGGAGALLTAGSSKITSNNPFIKAGVTLVPALTFAVINSLSNYAVYGYPMEQGFSETAWTQWKKFYAPLDYLSTLFK
ncbi:hypothetical protein [Endozoicomonas sp. 8E]|uniref:hypothetical protein n=1 Tax=Endozoicomonas sp. 8E TaxID=3035692 RepID=UPI002938CFD4|nr:hypothetical protein [Endozoicomonas sp. 8E]WOG27811.1 hypothetical protein P6910_25230 [Endozoicomonas sp. 8E]